MSLAILPNANRVSFKNSNISVTVYAEDLKRRLKPSKIANHKHHLEGENLRRTVCTPGTRVRILDDISIWAFDISPDSPTLYWLSGPAGSGKTTVAFTIARLLQKSPGPKLLGGNFFCSRQFPETKRASRILPTIVYHLALACNPFAEALNRCGDFDTVDHDIASQLDGLLIKPWAESEPGRLADPSTPPYYAIVIDALDEIEGTGGSEFLRALLDAIEEQHLRGLKFFVTSRPDPALVGRIASFPDRHLYRLETVPPDEARDDIKKYLGANLPDLRREVIEKLVNLADGLFIYAATIVKYLHGYESLEQEDLLENIFSTTIPVIPPKSPEFETSLLDELYRRILDDAFRGLQPAMRERRLRILHSFLCTAERTSTAVVAGLLAESPKQTESYMKIVNGVLESLHPVLYSDGDNVLWYHKSFPDFIFTQARSSKDFWCNQTVLNRQLTDSCLRVMKEGLRFNIAGIPSSSDLDSDNSTLLDAFRRDIPRVLVYSCYHWSHHLSASTSTPSDPLISTLEDFLALRVLFWIEAMNLLLSRGLCDPLLRRAGGWVAGVDAGVASKFYDAACFAVYFSSSPASLSTPHLYISALATAPLRLDHWKSYFPGIPRFTGDSQQTQGSLLMALPVGNSVDAVAVSKDGTNIAVGSGRGLLHVWSATTGEELRKLDGHHDRVTSVAFSNDGTRIVSGSADSYVRVWNANTGEELRKLDGHRDRVTCVAFSNDGTRIVSSSDDGSVRVWNANTGEELKKLRGHSNWVTSVAFSNDGTRIVSGSHDSSVRVWNVNTGEELRKLHGHSNWVTSVAFSHDGPRIVSGSYDKSVRVWNANTGEELRKLDGHSDMVTSVAFSNDGTRIISGSLDNSVRVWNASTGEELRKLDGHSDMVTSVAFSNDGTRIVSGSLDNSVRVWNANTGEEVRKLDGHSSTVTSVAFSNDGTRIVSGSYDNSVRVWNANTGEEVRKLDGHRDRVTSVAFSNDGTRIVSGSYDKSVRVWNANVGEELTKLDHSNKVMSVAFSNDGTCIVSGSIDKSVRVWNAITGKQVRKLDGHSSTVMSVAFSNDGLRIVSGSDDRSVRVWNANTGEELRKLDGHRNWVTSVAFSNDGTHIVSGSYDRSVQVWNANTGGKLRTLDGSYSVTSVAFSKDGTRIVSGSGGESVPVWNANTGEAVRKLDGHSRTVMSVAFSNDGTRIVSGSGDRSVRVWDANTGEELRKLHGHSTCVTSVSFSNDGTHIVSGSYDRSVRVWNVNTGGEVRTLDGRCYSVPFVTFSKDGTLIVSASDDEDVRLWNANTGDELRTPDGCSDSVSSLPFSNGGTRLISASDSNSVRLWNSITGEETRGVEHHQIHYICDKTGWLFSPYDSTRLMFVPPGALLPDSSLVLSIPPSASLNFTNACLGLRWVNCYCPSGQ